MSCQKYSMRQQIGTRIGIAGMTLNAVLFLAKCTMGLIGNSISVLADSLNNLTDCVSSLATFIGFKICARPADDRHPNGHGRMEYISGFIVSLFIIANALSFGKTAFLRILTPQTPDVSAGMLWIPAAAIALKLCFAYYVKYENQKIKSAAFKAMLKDSLSDAVLTSMTIISLLLSPFTGFPLDGTLSLVISAVILWSGVSSFMEHLDLLLGIDKDAKVKEQIMKTILSESTCFKDVISIKAFDYGPEKNFTFIKVSLNPKLKQTAIQDEVNKIIIKLKDSFDIEPTIYWNT